MRKHKLLLVTLTLLTSFLVVAYAQQPKGNSTSQRRLAIEIALSKSFVVKAGNAGRLSATFIRVPPQTGNDVQAEQIAAIKLVPKMAGDKVTVTISTVAGDTSGIKTCAEWNKLQESPIGSYTLSEGETVTVPQLTALGGNFKEGKLTFSAVAAAVDGAEAEGGPCECGTCGGLTCCPKPGFCLGCGSCGDVCCAAIVN